MSASMAEVLAKHQWYDASSDQEDPAIGCIGCDDWFGSEDALDDGTFAAHQAEVLAANGYGKLEDAWDEASEHAREIGLFYDVEHKALVSANPHRRPE